jgi:uncharacterized protein (TIGR00251 family)
MAEPFTLNAEGLFLAVRLTPRGGRDSIDGIEILSDGKAVLKARVRALPEDGEANAALVKLVAKFTGLASSRVTIQSGHTSRIKVLKIIGDPENLAAQIRRAGVA